MPPRIARASVSNNTPAAKKSKNKNKKRALNAYASAARQIPEGRINRNRLGEDLDDGPKRKRSREESDEEDEGDFHDDDDEDEDGPARKKVAKRGILSMGDEREHGSDSEGNEWTMGGLNDDEDDSDLDSDEAFGESDEEKFSGFTFRGSARNQKGKGKAKKMMARRNSKKEVDLDESDGEIDDGDSQDDEGETFGDDGVDLATMLDDDGDDDDDVEMKNATNPDSGSEEEEDDEDDEDDSDSDSDQDASDDSADEEAVARNMDRIVGLDPSRHSSTQQSEGVTTVDDFMDGSIAPLAPLKSKKSKKKGPVTQLAAKLPKRQQDRIDREIASAKAKEQLDRWQDTVKHHRREEFLTFPLQDPTDKSGITGKERFLPATQQAPQNELEASIQRIMEQSGLASNKPDEENVGEEEQALLKSEELATNKLPVEEVLRRRAELRKMRELLFREEIKAKRIAKIKSKSYRRVHRKEREREEEKERIAMQGLGGEVMDEDEKETQDRKRAEARMGTKHKESKWAKSLKATGRAVWDEGARDGVIEQARREEELRKRMDGRDVSGDESDGSLSPSEDEGDAPFTLRKLEQNRDDEKPKKGLANMKFMREAEERKQRANDDDVARLRKELAVEDGEEEDSEEGEESLGRALFGPRPTKNKSTHPKEQRLEFEAPDHSAEEDEDGEDDQDPQDQVKVITEKPKVKNGTARAMTTSTIPASKPKQEGWLRDIDDDDTSKSKANKGWLQAPKGTSRKTAVATDNLDLLKPVSNDPPGKSDKSTSSSKKPELKDTSSKDNTSNWTTIPHPNNPPNDEEEEGEEEDGEQTNPLLPPQTQSLQQRAFAGDDVALSFTEEKTAQAASEDTQSTSTYLPGWGSWTGDGLSRSIRKSNSRARHNPLFKNKTPGGTRPEDRLDKNLDKVIISQKGEEGIVRKGKKYLASQLPHEYQTKEQYERSRAMPVGVEWVTKGVHQRMVRPRVVVKKGVNVEALGRPVL